MTAALKADDCGPRDSLLNLARLRESMESIDSAEMAYWHAIHRGHPEALEAIARRLEESGNLTDAVKIRKIGLTDEVRSQTASDMHVTGADLHDEQAVQALEGDRAVRVEEVRREHRRGLRVQELPPRGVGVALGRRGDLQRLSTRRTVDALTR